MGHANKVSDALLKLRAAPQPSTKEATFWLLVDPVLHDPLGAAAEGLQQAIIPLTNVAKAMCPRLIQLHEEVDARLLQQSVETAIQELSGQFDDEAHGSPRSICAWLRPTPGLIDLPRSAGLLSVMAKLQPPNESSPPVSLRYWDPRITEDLIATMSSTDWANRLAHCGVAQWWHMDSFGSLNPSVLDESETPPALESPVWRPSISQWNQLNQVSWRNRIEQLSRSWDCPQPQQRSAINQLVMRAVQAGLKYEADVICFVHACLCIDLHFDRHPAAQMALVACKESNEAGLLQIQADIWRPAVEQQARQQSARPNKE